MNKEIYFVVSDPEAPIKLCFNMELAKELGGNYIDSFDENGELVVTYIWDTNSCEYIQDPKWESS